MYNPPIHSRQAITERLECKGWNITSQGLYWFGTFWKTSVHVIEREFTGTIDAAEKFFTENTPT